MASQLHSSRPTGKSSTDDSTDGAKAEHSQSRHARVKGSHIITEHIDVGVPPQVAFDQWSQYDKWSEMFKREGASTGRRRSGRDGRSEAKVRSKIGPSERQWTAEIVEVDPGRRIAWKSKGPVQAMGATSFHRLDDRLTHLMVEVEYRPKGLVETVGNLLRMQRRRVRRDLRLFKHYVELRGEATGKGPRRGGGDGLREAVDGRREG